MTHVYDPNANVTVNIRSLQSDLPNSESSVIQPQNIPTSRTLTPRSFRPARRQALLKYRRLNLSAYPLIKRREDAGYDLKSIETVTVPARGTLVIGTGLAIELPPRTYGRIAPRSGLAACRSIDVGAGVIDEGFRGEIRVVLFNHSDTDFNVNTGDRIAQLLVVKLETVIPIEIQHLTESERGCSGFGSSGI